MYSVNLDNLNIDSGQWDRTKAMKELHRKSLWIYGKVEWTVRQQKAFNMDSCRNIFEGKA